jgi:hypothetical protein
MSTVLHSFLYYFQNEYMTLVEVKRDDLPASARPDQVYAWLVIDPKKKEFRKLGFKSMNSEMVNGNLINIRGFNEGELRFDALFAKFVYGPNSHLLENSKVESVTSEVKDIVKQYLTSLS